MKGLATISVRAATALGRHIGPLNIGVTAPSDEIVTLLAGNRGELGLNAVAELTPVAAKVLGKTHEGVLGLNGLTDISADVAKALSAHRGMIGLTGITTLSPAAATALAHCDCPIYLTDSKGFPEEVRAILSQHHGRVFLTGVDLPQCFEVDEGWIAQGARAETITRAAIANALGDDLPQKDADGLSGVALHSRFRNYLNESSMPNFYGDDPRCLLVPAPADETDQPDNPTCVRVDSLSGAIVCVEKIFPDTRLEDVLDAVVKRFGKTDKQIDERSFVLPLARQKITSIRYTFPDALVRIIGTEGQDFRGNVGASTSVWICSRPWVEENLRAYANSVFTSCAWAKQAMDAWNGERFTAGAIEPLPGTESRVGKSDESILFVDVHRGRVREHLAELLPVNEEDEDSAERSTLNAERRSIVGCVGTVPSEDATVKIPVIVVAPLNSTVAGFRPILSRDSFQGPCDIAGTRVNDVLRDVASHICQSCFEPRTDTITVVRGQNDARFAVAEQQADLGRIHKEFRHAADMARFEWVDTSGWTVRACFDGQICFFKTPTTSSSDDVEGERPAPPAAAARPAPNVVAHEYPKYEALARQLLASSRFRKSAEKKASAIRNTIEVARELGVTDERLVVMLEESLANSRSNGLDDSFAVTTLESGVQHALAMKKAGVLAE